MKRILLITSILFISIASYAGTSGQEVVEHRVRWYESVSSIARKYGVTVEDILKYNNLESGDVRSNMILLIPMGAPDHAVDPGDNSFPETATDSIPAEVTDTAAVQEILPDKVFGSDNPMSVSLVLPFGAGTGQPSVNFFDFYSGALMALDSLRAHGMSVVLNVFDCKGKSAEELFQDDAFASSDLIIGPVQTEELSPFAQFAKEHSIPIVSPMDHGAEVLTEGNPYLFQAPASVSVQESNLIGLLDVTAGDKVLVIFDSSMREQQYVDRITSLLDNQGIGYQKIGYGLLHGRTLSDSLKRQLDRASTYKVIVASQDDAFAPDIVRNMRVLKLFDIPIQLFCSNRVRNFESIDSDSFFELSTHVCTPYYTDYSSEPVRNFVFRYRALYNTEPTPFSFQGYDLISFFVSNIYKASGDFIRNAGSYGGTLMQSNVRFFRNNEDCGWQNTATRNLVYNPDFTISIVK